MIRIGIALFAIGIAAAPALAKPHATHATPAPELATGGPMPIGHVSREVSPVGFTYRETPGLFGLPATAPSNHSRHKPGVKKAALKPALH